MDFLDKLNKEAIVDSSQFSSSVHLKFHEEYAGTYFVDAREPEPEELNSLLTEPLPPPGIFHYFKNILVKVEGKNKVNRM